jgi:hypothetical protein
MMDERTIEFLEQEIAEAKAQPEPDEECIDSFESYVKLLKKRLANRQ